MSAGPARRRTAIEIAIVTAVILGMSVLALWRMDYLDADTAHQIRMTDSTRTAYVAKNIVEGRGYTTNELPAFLVGFYKSKGKLHQDRWVNADRFPFTAYAVAALYMITRSTSEEVGILGYNLICFVAFLVLLYWMTRVVWDDKWSALFALTIALLHPLTYNYLYLKDGDMMLLTTGVLLCLYRYFEKPPDQLSWKRAAVLGTLIAWLYLCRPNIGGAFVLYFVIVILRRLWAERKTRGVVGAIKLVALHEGIVMAVAAVWLIPFVIHSMSAWGEPMFTANAWYQRPLGTRFAMDTDTWWKYSDPAQIVSLDTLRSGAPSELLAKFTTSWVVTIKTTVATWAGEFILAFGLLAWLSKRPKPKPASKSKGKAKAAADPDDKATPDHPDRAKPVRRLAGVVGFCVLVNFAVLPLYGAQNYGYRHYLSFFLPLIWLCAGRAMVHLVDKLKPVVRSVVDHIRANPGKWLAVLVVGVVIWNFGPKAQEANQMFVVTSRFIARHWLSAVIILGFLAWHRFLFRGSTYTRAVLVLTILVLARWVPRTELKMLNLHWFPADERVYDELAKGKGLVVSLAMQGEVNWASDRRNIPAPENVLHVYSLLGDHDLEVEDLYIESAEAMVALGGVFHYAAPGFEGYVRMQHYRGRLPGYEVVFHAETVKGYPKYKVKPMPKASTVWRLVDRVAARAVLRSPDRIDIGNMDSVAYTTHGWGDYFLIDGKSVVAATDFTRMRYRKSSLNKPVEDTSMSFFLDDRRPRSIDLEVYATHATTLDLYWNLDLFAYDLPGDRGKHLIGTYTLSSPGWQRIHLEVPATLTRKGINKLGFRAGTFESVTTCPPSMTDDACAKLVIPLPREPDEAPPLELPAHVLRPVGVTTATAMRTSVFVSTLELTY